MVAIHRFLTLALLQLAIVIIVINVAVTDDVFVHYPILEDQKSVALVAVGIFAIGQLLWFVAFDLHRINTNEPALNTAAKFVLSLFLGAVVPYLLFSGLPEPKGLRDSIPDAALFAAVGLVVVRAVQTSGVRLDLFAHRRVLVLGTGHEAAEVERTLRNYSSVGVTVVGFYPTNSGPCEVSSQSVLSSSLSLESTVRRLFVDELIVAVREQRGGTLPLSQLLNCRLRGVRVTNLSGFFERVTGEVPVDSLKSSWLIYSEGFRQDWARRFVKRTFDITAGTLLLMLALPIMLAAAVAILLESGYPIVFRQERVGQGGRTFILFKFRSMRNDAERDGVPRWASEGDSRITRVGRFVRRTRIDELPQLINVLRGEMSFVGPRPERPFFVAELSKNVPFYGARHTVKPGLTGWAQVRYSYGASMEDAVKKLQFDLYYVKNHSLLLDIVILIRTVRVVLLGEGAR